MKLLSCLKQEVLFLFSFILLCLNKLHHRIKSYFYLLVYRRLIININDLDDLALQQVFDWLPLQDLIRTSQVCRRWKRIQRKACRSRRSICLIFYIYRKTIFVSYNFHSVSVTQFDQATCNWILLNFVSIDSLKIFHISHQVLPLVTYLVKHYASQLVTLWLNFDPLRKGMKVNISEIHNLIDQINTMPCLKFLDLNFCCKIVSKNGNRSIDLPILAQLKELVISSSDNMRIFQNSFLAYLGLNPDLEIFCCNPISKRSTLNNLLKLDHLCNRFLQLNFIYLLNLTLHDLENICNHFSSLTAICITPFQPNLSLSQIVTCLALLPKLYDVHVDIAEDEHPSEPFEADEMETKLPKVKILRIRAYITVHSDLANIWSRYERIFTNLSQLSYVCVECKQCGHEYSCKAWYEKYEQMQLKCVKEQVRMLPRKIQLITACG